MPKKQNIILLCGSAQEATYFLYKRQKESPNYYSNENYIYGYGPECLYGVTADKVKVFGNFWTRPHCQELFEIANSRLRNV